MFLSGGYFRTSDVLENESPKEEKFKFDLMVRYLLVASGLDFCFCFAVKLLKKNFCFFNRLLLLWYHLLKEMGSMNLHRILLSRPMMSKW